MSDNTILYALGGLAATEATGITNFTGGESSGGIDLGPISDRINQAEDAARLAQMLAQAGQSASEYTRIIERGGGGNQVYKFITETVGGTNGSGQDGLPEPDGEKPQDNTGGEGTDIHDFNYQSPYDLLEARGMEIAQTNYKGDTHKNQNFANPKPGMQAGDWIAGASESMHQAGQIVKGGTDIGSKTVNTYGALAKAVTGQKYSTKNTFADNGGGTTRRLYKGSLGSNAAGVLDKAGGGIDEAVGRQFDDKKGGGIFDVGPLWGNKKKDKPKKPKKPKNVR